MKNYASCTDEALALLYIDGDNKAFDELLARNQQSNHQVARWQIYRFGQVCFLADTHCP